MPVKRIAYSCEFKCGRKVVLTRIRMAKHERECFYNPERKACQTCHFHEYSSEEGNYCELLEHSELRADCTYWHKEN